MRNKVFVFFICALVLTLTGFILSGIFEIYPQKVRRGYSNAARKNEYFAMERWLETTGHPVTVITGALEFPLAIKEKVVILSSTRLDDIKGETFAWFITWVAEGGHLLLWLGQGTGKEAEKRLKKNFVQLGLRFQRKKSSGYSSSPDFPRFDRDFLLKPIKTHPLRPGMKLRKDSSDGSVRLITVGAGTVSVSGRLYFMRNETLKNEKNAALAWELTGARDTNNCGVCFIRTAREHNTLYSAISSRGSIGFALAGALIVLVTGFWMVIPVFGRWRSEAPRPGRSIRERFLAEGLFLKKFHALEVYREAYIREIRLKLGAFAGEELAAAQLAGRCGLPLRDVENALRPGKKFREFLHARKILETILERL